MFESNQCNNGDNGNIAAAVLEVGNIRRKRDEYLVEIRKGQRDKKLQTKRMRKLDEDWNILQFNEEEPNNNQSDEEYTELHSLKKHIDKCLKRTFDPSQFRELYESLHSNDKFIRHYGMIGMRKILSLEDRSPVQLALDSHLIPKLVEFAKNEQEEQLQLEATWALTNIAAGSSEQTEAVIEGGAIPVFIWLLSSRRVELIEQSVWAIGNISGDCAEYRDHILYNEVMKPMNKVINDALDDKQDSLVKQGTWAMSNLCRGTPLPEFDLVKTAIPTLSRVIQEQHNYEALSDACWAMAHLSDGDEHRIEMVVETGIVSSLVRNLDNPYIAILVPLLRIIGNISTSNDDHIEFLLENPKVIEKLYKLLSHETKTVRREASWVLSNIAAGREHQIEHVFAEPVYVHTIIKLALSDNIDVRKEAAWALCNGTNGGNPEQVTFLVKNGAMDCFCELLHEKDIELLEVGLEGIYNILNTGALVAHNEHKKENEFLVLLEEKGAIQNIEKLQKHKHNKIYRLALNILTKHFEIEEFL